uniref:protein Flattop n=1 Tax=Semicossyphus pulcher TaxID=241346 RepID=UPI0037E8B9E2
MSSSYSANQYDGAFRSHRLQNWCETKRFKERPTAQEGHTTFIADNRGHLLPGVGKRGSAWPDFKGTWDLPARIPARCINPTGRSVEGLNRLKSWGFDPRHSGASEPHGGSTNTDRLQNAGEQGDDVQQDGAEPPSSAAEARPASQDRPVTAGCQNQVSLAAVSPGSDGRPEAAQRTSSRAHSVTGRPGSDVAEKVVPRGSTSSSSQRHGDAQQDQ